MRFIVTGITKAAAALALSCIGIGAATASVPTATLLTSTMAVRSGGAATLTWGSTNATSCTASDAWRGTLAPNGTQSTGPLTKNSTFVLTCSGPGGISPAFKAGINVVPTASVTANPTSVASGSSAALRWSSTNAKSCTASGGWSGALATSGTQSTGALLQNTSFFLTCHGVAGNSAAATVAVTVTSAVVPTVSLLTSTGAVPSGGAATLTWSSTDAIACTASGGWTGTLASSGTKSTGALTLPSSYSLTCTGAGGTSARSNVLVNIIPTATLTASPSVVASGGKSTLTWSSTNATACTASGGWSGTLARSGSRGTGTLEAATSYAVTCSGAGGVGNVAEATVTISNGTLSLSPRIAAITRWQTQRITATVPGGGGATWSVDGVSGGNGTVGTVSSSGLYTPGTAVGTHTVVATSSANSSQSGSAVVAVTDLAGVYGYHNDLASDGANIHEFALTTATVKTATFGKLFSCAADGAIYAQPLWVADVTVSSAQHNVVVVATQHDGLFAYDADASPCVTLWNVSLIDSSHGGLGGETSVPSAKSDYLVGNGNGTVSPEVGATGTPVIDPAANTLYVVSKSVNAARTTFYQRLHAIDLATGNEKAGSPVTIAATYPGTGSGGSTVSFNAQQEFQRSGLVLLNGVVYIAWASHEDNPPYFGWIMGYTYKGSSFVQSSVVNVTPNVGYGGIWMSGAALSADSNNHLYAITGNGGFDATNSSAPNNDYGDSLLQLTSSLNVSHYFTPSDQLKDQQQDGDFGSGGAAVLADLPAGSPATHLVLGGGKDGNLYVLNRDHLGGLGDSAAVQKVPLGHGIFCTGAFWNNTFYIAGAGGPLLAYLLDTSTAQFNLSASSTVSYPWPGATPSITAAGSQGGIVWVLNTSPNCTSSSTGCGPTVLHAHDASNLTELWNSAMVSGDAAGNAVKFVVPTIANGKVYVATRGNNAGYGSSSVPGELDIYGLTQ